MSSPAVSFVVVNWNRLQLLQRCIPSILAQSFSNFEVIVVDNGSTDGSREYLRSLPGVHVIELPENRGYGGPSNLAFQRARGEWIATVNNDMTLDADWLHHLVRAVECDPGCFSVQGRNLKEGEPSRIDGCGLGLRACGAARRLLHNRTEIPDQAEPIPVFAVSSGAALYRKQMLADLGYLDATYFIYYEDLDVGWRARHRGWHSMFVPRAVARHRVHATSRERGEGLLWYLGERNRLRTLVKNLPFGALLKHPLLIGLDELRYLHMIHRNVRLWTLVKARIDVMREMPALWRRRSAGLKHRGTRDWLEWLAMGPEAERRCDAPRSTVT